MLYNILCACALGRKWARILGREISNTGIVQKLIYAKLSGVQLGEFYPNFLQHLLLSSKVSLDIEGGGVEGV